MRQVFAKSRTETFTHIGLSGVSFVLLTCITDSNRALIIAVFNEMYDSIHVFVEF